MNIAVGARSGIVDDLFVGNFLGKDCTRSSTWMPRSIQIPSYNKMS
jgi:hypothetical protein